jgi:phenylalanyl-tRNA synthetase beta chain
MKISLQWLRTYLPDAPDALTCGDALTLAGLPTEAFERHGEDDVFDVEVTSNRSDCLSHVGVARELGALRNLRVVEPESVISNEVVGELLPVRVEDGACLVYTARVIRGVRVGASPDWLRRHLEAIGLRPINNVVDVTNFILMEMGQPLHAFDLNKIAGREIIVRKARVGEELVSLDGHSRKLDGSMLVIADRAVPVAIAGIMGGKPTEVSEGTTDVLLESAIFDPLTVRRTARRLGLRSDSSYRYERGLDPTLAERASRRACQLMVELAGGSVVRGVVRVGAGEPVAKKLWLRMGRLKEVLGYEISREAAVDALARLRMVPVVEGGERGEGGEGDRIGVTVPADRLDINIEVDLVEEVARVTGYEHIPERDAIQVRLTPPDLTARSMGIINEVAVGAGHFEAITFSFVTDSLAGDFLPEGAASLPRADHGTRKADAQLRPSLLPGLLEALRRNESSGNGAVKLYETGSTFIVDAGGKLVEKRKIALVGGTSVAEIRGTVEALLGRLDARRVARVEPRPLRGYDEGGTVYWGDWAVGSLGVVADSVVRKLDLRHVPVAAEMELAPLVGGTVHVPQLVPLPKFPAVERDVSLVVAEEVRYEQVLGLLAGLKLPDLETVTHVTTYRGKPLEKGTKSVTVKLVFRSAEKSLTSEAVDGSVSRFVEAARAGVGAVLRV